MVYRTTCFEAFKNIMNCVVQFVIVKCFEKVFKCF